MCESQRSAGTAGPATIACRAGVMQGWRGLLLVIAVLVAARGSDHRYWKLVEEGHNHIFANGTHEWRKTPDDPRHCYISALGEGVKAEEVSRTIENLMVRKPRK